ncbi:DUF1566 domain-containing protein [Vibrio navarrensis]
MKIYKLFIFQWLAYLTDLLYRNSRRPSDESICGHPIRLFAASKSKNREIVVIQLKTNHAKVLVSTLLVTALIGCGGDESGGDDSGQNSGEPQVEQRATLSAIASTGGAISPEQVTVEKGESVTFTVTADEGFELSRIAGCDGQLTGNLYHVTAAKESCRVEAQFHLKRYTVSSTVTGNGEVMPPELNLAHGEQSTVSLNPHEGFSLHSATGCGGTLAGNSYTIAAMSENCVINAVFTPTVYTVTASASNGGAISPSTQTVNYAGSATFTLTPEAGYQIDAVTGCNGSLNGNTYTTSAISAACSVNASFKQVAQVLTGKVVIGAITAADIETSPLSNALVAEGKLQADGGFTLAVPTMVDSAVQVQVTTLKSGSGSDITGRLSLHCTLDKPCIITPWQQVLEQLAHLHEGAAGSGQAALTLLSEVLAVDAAKDPFFEHAEGRTVSGVNTTELIALIEQNLGVSNFVQLLVNEVAQGALEDSSWLTYFPNAKLKEPEPVTTDISEVAVDLATRDDTYINHTIVSLSNADGMSLGFADVALIETTQYPDLLDDAGNTIESVSILYYGFNVGQWKNKLNADTTVLRQLFTLALPLAQLPDTEKERLSIWLSQQETFGQASTYFSERVAANEANPFDRTFYEYLYHLLAQLEVEIGVQQASAMVQSAQYRLALHQQGIATSPLEGLKVKSRTARATAASASNKELAIIPNVLTGQMTHSANDALKRIDVINHSSLFYAMHKTEDLGANGFAYYWNGNAIAPSYGSGFVTTQRVTDNAEKTNLDITGSVAYSFYRNDPNTLLDIPTIFNAATLLTSMSGVDGMNAVLKNSMKNDNKQGRIATLKTVAINSAKVAKMTAQFVSTLCELNDMVLEHYGRANINKNPLAEALGIAEDNIGDFCTSFSRLQATAEYLLDFGGATIDVPPFNAENPWGDYNYKHIEKVVNAIKANPKLLLGRLGEAPKQGGPSPTLVKQVLNSGERFLVETVLDYCLPTQQIDGIAAYKPRNPGSTWPVKELAKYLSYKDEYINSFHNAPARYDVINRFYRNETRRDPEAYLQAGLVAMATPATAQHIMHCVSNMMGQDGFEKILSLLSVTEKLAKAMSGENVEFKLADTGYLVALLGVITDARKDVVTKLIAEFAAKQAAAAAMGPYGVGVRIGMFANTAGAMGWDAVTKPSYVNVRFSDNYSRVETAIPPIDQLSYLSFNADETKGLISQHNVPALGAYTNIGTADSDYAIAYSLAKESQLNSILMTAHNSFSFDNIVMVDNSQAAALKNWLDDTKRGPEFNWQVRHCPVSNRNCYNQQAGKPQSWPIFGDNDLSFSLTANEAKNSIKTYDRRTGVVGFRKDNMTNPLLFKYAQDAVDKPVDGVAYISFSDAYQNKIGKGRVRHNTPGMYYDSTAMQLGDATYHSSVNVFVAPDYSYSTANAKSHNQLLNEQSLMLQTPWFVDEFGNPILQTYLLLQLERPEGNFNYICSREKPLDSCINNQPFDVWVQKWANGPFFNLGETKLGYQSPVVMDISDYSSFTQLVLIDAVTRQYLQTSGLDVSSFITAQWHLHKNAGKALPFMLIERGSGSSFTEHELTFAAEATLQQSDFSNSLVASLRPFRGAKSLDWYLVKGEACSSSIEHLSLPADKPVYQLPVGYTYQSTRRKGQATPYVSQPPQLGNCTIERVVEMGTLGKGDILTPYQLSNDLTENGSYYMVFVVHGEDQPLYLRSAVTRFNNAEQEAYPVIFGAECQGSMECGILLDFDASKVLADGYQLRLTINGEAITLRAPLETGSRDWSIRVEDLANGRFMLHLTFAKPQWAELTIVMTTPGGSSNAIGQRQSGAIAVAEVVASNQTLTLSWADIAADHYNVLISSQQGFDPDNYANYPDAALHRVTDTSVQLTGLRNNQRYYLRLEAEKSQQRLRSAEFGATPGLPNTGTTGKLNDTGIGWCADGSQNNLDCPVQGYEGQDGDHGRDALARSGQLQKIGGGAAGFDFTKLDNSGNPLPASASEWSCVRDNHTGLIWEVKQPAGSGGLRDANHTYSWYNPDNSTNGGNAGTQNGGTCQGSDCDTAAFINAVNSQGLCGASDWRLPTVKELMSIVHNGRTNPAIDLDYFPNFPNITPFDSYWTSVRNAPNAGNSWMVMFSDGAVAMYRSGNNFVRLVRNYQ